VSRSPSQSDATLVLALTKAVMRPGFANSILSTRPKRGKAFPVGNLLLTIGISVLRAVYACAA